MRAGQKRGQRNAAQVEAQQKAAKRRSMGTRSLHAYMWMVLLEACALWKSPEVEVLTELRACEAGTTRKIGSGELKAERMFFQRLTVVFEEDKKRAHVVGTLDLDGVWAGQAQAEKEQYIRSLGFERVEFVYEEGKWKALRGCFPQLEAVVLFLSEEEAKEELNTVGWNIRLEREEVRISQEYKKTQQGEGEGWRSFSLRRGADGKLRNVDAR